MNNTQKKRKLLISAMAGLLMIPGNAMTVKAAEDVPEEASPLPIVGIEDVLDQYLGNELKNQIDLYSVQTEKGEYLNTAVSNVSEFAYIRTATVTADVLNVRDGQGTDAMILTQILQDQVYEVLGDAVDNWYPVRVGEIDGWVCGEYVTISETFSYDSREEENGLVEEDAERTEEEAERKAQEQQEASVAASYTLSNASSGQAVIEYACQFIGNPYVWGGTSLTEGADCSGFVQSVYANFGVSLPRTTWEMENAGYAVSYEEALPGDLILYDGHVGLYMGDGTIVNAMNEVDGIGICSATYAPIVTVRRVL